MIEYFSDFYEDFDRSRAFDMLKRLNINPSDRLRTMSKGTKEKVQLILVMSRRASIVWMSPLPALTLLPEIIFSQQF